MDFILNPMDYHGTQFLQTLDLFMDRYFAIILLLSSWTFLTQLRVPPAPLAFLIQFLSPVYEEFLDSAIFNVKIKYPSLNKFFEPCVANWQTFQCWHIPPPVILHLRSYDGYFCSCKCKLAATASKQTLLCTSPSHHPLPRWSPSHNGGGLSWDDN